MQEPYAALGKYSTGLYWTGYLTMFAGIASAAGKGCVATKATYGNDVPIFLAAAGDGLVSTMPWAAGIFALGLFLTILASWPARRL